MLTEHIQHKLRLFIKFIYYFCRFNLYLVVVFIRSDIVYNIGYYTYLCPINIMP